MKLGVAVISAALLLSGCGGGGAACKSLPDSLIATGIELPECAESVTPNDEGGSEVVIRVDTDDAFLDAAASLDEAGFEVVSADDETSGERLWEWRGPQGNVSVRYVGAMSGEFPAPTLVVSTTF